MRVTRAFRLPHILAVVALPVLASRCRTTAGSSAKDLPVNQIETMTLQQWVAACQTELANPQTGAKSLADLQKLANTTDCATAYPAIKDLFASYGSPAAAVQ